MRARGSRFRLVLLVLFLMQHGPRPTRSQLGGGGWGREGSPGGVSSPGADSVDSGPQLGKLADTGPQLGKLSDGGGEAASEPALQDLVRRQRGQVTAGARNGADLGGDMSSFFKKSAASEEPGTGGFDPSRLAPGAGGGSVPGTGREDGGSGGFNPSKLASSGADDTTALNAKQDSTLSSRGRGGGEGGAGAGASGSTAQKPRPWETGGGSSKSDSGRRSDMPSGGGGKKAMDTIGDLDLLEQSVSSNIRKEHAREEKTEKAEKKSWLDTASSWFKGDGAKDKGRRDKAGKTSTASSRTRSHGGADPMQQVQSKVGSRKSDTASPSKGTKTGKPKTGAPESAATPRAATSAGRGGKEEPNDSSNGAPPKADPLDAQKIEEFYRQLNAKKAQGGGSSAGAGPVGGGSAAAASELGGDAAPMSSLEPPVRGGAGSEAPGRALADRNTRTDGEGGTGRGRGRPAPPPANTPAPNIGEADSRTRAQASMPAEGAAYGSGGRVSGGAREQGGASMERRRPRPPPVDPEDELSAAQRGPAAAGESGSRRRRRPRPPPVEQGADGGVSGQLLIEGPRVSLARQAWQTLRQLGRALAGRVLAILVAANRRLDGFLSGFQAKTDEMMRGGEYGHGLAGAHEELYLSAYRRDDAARDHYWQEKGKAYAAAAVRANQQLQQENEHLVHQVGALKQVVAAQNASLASSQQIVAAVAGEKRLLQDELAACQLVVGEHDDLVAAASRAEAERDGARQDLARAQEVTG